jgi:hypothetical protein
MQNGKFCDYAIFSISNICCVSMVTSFIILFCQKSVTVIYNYEIYDF